MAINGMVAELQAAQQAHAESEARYHAVADEMRENQRALLTLMSNLPGMAYRCKSNRDWTMEFVSEGCLKLTGYPAADLIGSHALAYTTLIHPADREAVLGRRTARAGRGQTLLPDLSSDAPGR